MNDYDFLKHDSSMKNSIEDSAGDDNAELSCIVCNITVSSVNIFFIAEKKGSV